MVGIIFGLVVLTTTQELWTTCPAFIHNILYVMFNTLMWTSVVATIVSGIIYLKDSLKSTQ